MSNESISRIVGTAVGAAIIVAGLAAFGPRATSSIHDSAAQPLVPVHASETITVFNAN